MRCLNKNKQTIYYALYTGKTAVVDAHGLKTGQYTVSYGTPVALKVNFSNNSGSSVIGPTGVVQNYYKNIVVDDLNCPIEEDTILWIGKEPYSGSTLTKHNFVVTQVSKSLNSVSYNVEEVQ